MFPRAAIPLLLILVPATSLALDEELRARARDPDSFRRSAAARDLAKVGTPEAAAVLRELLEDRNPYVRDHTVLACGRLKDEKALSVLAGAANHRSELLRSNLAEALGRTKSRAVLGVLERFATKDRAARVRARALDWLWGYSEDAGALAICAKAFEDRDPLVRAAAMEAAGRIKGEGALDLVRRGLVDKDEGVRCVARMELRYLSAGEASAGLPDLAASPGWRSRAQAVDDALALRDRPAVDALVTLVGDDRLAVSCAAHRALRLLSGKEIGRDPELWRSWWEASREGWKPPRGRLEELSAGEGGGRSVARFHGMEITSDHVVFVIDISGSMAQPLEGDTKGRTRWQGVQDELSRTLTAMPDGARVNLIVFGERSAAAFPKPTALNRTSRARIASFAERSRPGGKGNLLAAMLEALAQEDTDTVLLLSDGAPSGGDMVDKGRVRSAIRQLDRMRKVRIHALGYGSRKDTERRFMQGLARDSGGVCRFK